MAKTHEFTVSAQELCYDVAVCGGGVAGAAAALNAARNGAKTLLIESGGALGGDITKGFVPQLLDPVGKGGFVKEINDYLNANGHTAPRRGPHYDENGKKLPGTLIEVEYLMYFLDKTLMQAGVDVFYNSMASAVELDNGRITSLLVTTEAGNYAVKAPIYIDATGNGLIAGFCGCPYEFGHPDSGLPQPASMGAAVTGVPEGFRRTDSEVEKMELRAYLEEQGIHVSSTGVSLVPGATDNCWGLSVNFQYNVPHDNILGISRATQEGRIECIESAEALRSIPGLEKLTVLNVSSHLGIREGKRILGEYQLTVNDIISGARFDDAVCLVRFGVDVHSIHSEDKQMPSNGKRTQPYHIPYRCLLPKGCDNLLLAGRCISGDFYAHSSYRVACDMIPTGEAAGYAAAVCVKNGITPRDVDGRKVREYMAKLNYEL